LKSSKLTDDLTDVKTHFPGADQISRRRLLVLQSGQICLGPPAGKYSHEVLSTVQGPVFVVELLHGLSGGRKLALVLTACKWWTLERISLVAYQGQGFFSMGWRQTKFDPCVQKSLIKSLIEPSQHSNAEWQF
jgi:hypothetical protein